MWILCIGFIYFTLKGKIFLDYTNLLSPNEYKKNDKIILKCKELNDKDGNYRKFKNPKISHIFKKTLVLSIICSKCKNEGKKNI